MPISEKLPLKQVVTSKKLLLFIVVYHPNHKELKNLSECLSKLPLEIGYAIVVNDYCDSDNIIDLEISAEVCLRQKENLGYGRAINSLVSTFEKLPPYIGVLNQDLVWDQGTFEKMLYWLNKNPEVSLAVPKIIDDTGKVQKLCKRHPTVLGLFSRRFIWSWLKPKWLLNYDRWYEMSSYNYNQVFEAQYLSGCCMIIRGESFVRIGGFDERFFLYLEDADLTRRLACEGKCIHLPIAEVQHDWGRGNYKSFLLMLVNLKSAWIYFTKWGWSLW